MMQKNNAKDTSILRRDPKTWVKAVIGIGALVCSALPYGVSAAEEGLLRTLEIRYDNLSALPQWQNVVYTLPSEEATLSACLKYEKDCTDKSYKVWRDVMLSLKDQPLFEKMQRINRYVNSWPYRKDTEAWGRDDYWAVPSDFFKKSGDSEDFAIMKYVSLKLAGVPAEKMRLVVARDVMRNTTQTLLAVYVSADDVEILDNYIEAVMNQNAVLQYVPLFSVSEHARWVHVQRGARPSFTPNYPQ